MHLQFHPTTAAPVLAAADKAGHVALWAVRYHLYAGCPGSCRAFLIKCRAPDLLISHRSNILSLDVPSLVGLVMPSCNAHWHFFSSQLFVLSLQIRLLHTLAHEHHPGSQGLYTHVVVAAEEYILTFYVHPGEAG